MGKSITPPGVVPAAIVGEAWQQVAASFDRFCLTAGIATPADMMEQDAARLCGVRYEVHTIGLILIEVTKALAEVTKQIFTVDDCLGDGKSERLSRNLTQSRVVAVYRSTPVAASSSLLTARQTSANVCLPVYRPIQ
jgi:hypothetical protein